MYSKSFFILLIAGMAVMDACTNESNTAAKGVDSAVGEPSSTTSTAGAANSPDSSAKTTDSSAQHSSRLNDSSKRLDGGSPPDYADLTFLKKAASGGRLEVQLGSLSAQNGASPRVKSFGEMMIKDHTDANNSLKNVAEQLNAAVSDSLLPAHEHHKMMLSMKKGSEFDKAYMKMMVEDHNEDIADFQKASKSNNPRIKNFAIQTLPVLFKHLDSAKAILAGHLK